MRSVFTFLPSCTQEEVQHFLGVSFPASGTDLRPPLDGIVTIEFYTDLASEAPEDLAAIVQSIGSDFISVSADITGRYYGIKSPVEFCVSLLKRFGGVAMDDYSGHLWTLDELTEGYQGRRFFIP